ncbi:MAG: oxygen-independent coproporphyrinogen III oxidase [Planctomycetes bacterium]|nr:oxygen-independent coproporphyrinogen III oxidase [Planctomycetota bacterium]
MHLSSETEVSSDLLLAYDKPGPRYTSYPTAPVWKDEFGPSDFRKALRLASETPDVPLSMYLHIPFCPERCTYCACNVIITKKEDVVQNYTETLKKEISMAAEALGARRKIVQLHLGGGTPTYLTISQLEELCGHIANLFTIDENAEMALEADPCVTSHEQIRVLRSIGFNRISLGVQDLDPKVQDLIGRQQTVAITEDIFGECREQGYSGINMDLIFGLPGQTASGFAKTVEEVIRIRPDRLAVYSYAHVPWMRVQQKQFDAASIPEGKTKYEIFANARRMLIDAGYRAIGMDHFSLPEDELSRALETGELSRNFMGYTVTKTKDVVGLGTSGISEVAGCYAQNTTKLSVYHEAIEGGEFATEKGIWLTRDDVIRRRTLRLLMCTFEIDFETLRSEFEIEFSSYFAEEMKTLGDYEREGFLEISADRLTVLPLGKVFIRNVGMVFDKYLSSVKRGFSRTI